jgi:hypothetical protein
MHLPNVSDDQPAMKAEAGPSPLPWSILVVSAVAGCLWHLVLLCLGAATFVAPDVSGETANPQRLAARIIRADAPGWAAGWYQWDALWFVHLSRYGYVLELGPDGVPAQSNIAFTPGLAIVEQALDRLTGSPWAAILGFNVVADFAAMLGLAAIARRLTGSRSATIWTIVAFNAWPWRFFLVAPYQEAAGAALTFWSIETAMAGRIGCSFLLALFSSAFRLNAVGLLGGWAAGRATEAIRGPERKLLLGQAFAACGVVVGWAALLAFFRYEFGDASLGVTIQRAWGRRPPHLSGLIESLGSPILHTMTGSEWLDWAAACAVVSSVPIVWRKFGMSWGLSVTGLSVQALSTGRVLSFGRFAVLACPFFVAIGLAASRRPRLAVVGCLLGLSLQIFLMQRFGHGLFAG